MKDQRLYLGHILESITAIENYTVGCNKQEFLQQPEKQDAVIRRLEVIGEAARHLSDGLFKATAQIEWRAVKAMRNFLIHEYFRVDLNLVWKVVKKDLPQMKKILSVLETEKYT